MNGMRLWFVALVLHTFLSSIDCGKKIPHNRRAGGAHINLPVSKGGWRPVVGSGGLLYGPQGTAPLHSSYKIPLLDLYPSSSRPVTVTTRDINKLTSIAQSYRPTTLRTVPVSSHIFPTNQPINSYLNPFALPNNGQNYYKFLQNYQIDNVLNRNIHNPYAARPVLQKQQVKQKQQYHNNILQQLSNIQPIQFGQYPTVKPIDIYGKPNEAYSRPDGKRPQSAETEIFKPEVYKLPDTNTVSQYSSQPVKTAQQQSFGQQQEQQQQHQQSFGKQQQQQQLQSFGKQQPQQPLQSFGKQQQPQQQLQSFGKQQQPQQQPLNKQSFAHQQSFGPKQPIGQYAGTQNINQYGHPFQDTLSNYQQFPPSILGTFGSFGLQSVKGRDPHYPGTKTTFAPQQPTKQTYFNSFNYFPNLLKSTPALFSSTTPRLTTAQKNLIFRSTLNHLGYAPTQQTKLASQVKIDPNEEIKNFFKASPQDPFIKKLHNVDYNKITTYNPQLQQTSTLSSPLYNDYKYQSQNVPIQSYDDLEYSKNSYDTNKQKASDNVGLTQQVSQQYINAPGLFDLETSLNALSHRPSYAVVENLSEDIITSASPAAWTITPGSHSDTINEEAVTQHERPTTTITNIPEEFSIVTESDSGNKNVAINYDSQVESQSRRPLGDDFEPISKTKLKDYYYRVSTPTYNDHKPYRRLKKPTVAPKSEVTTESNLNKENNGGHQTESLPTLPPSLHFKRPSAQEPTEKDRIRKRNKIRRRRPNQPNRSKEEINVNNEVSSTEAPATTISEEIHTIRPRIRPTKSKPEPTVTTPSITTELTTSALPTTSPTKPTLVKKKLLSHRRPSTTPSERLEETTTQAVKENIRQDVVKESSIMKILSRPQTSKPLLHSYERINETPDYSHKQDEKDTPTSDVSVSLTDTFKTTDSLKEFSFHRDARPVENKDSTIESIKVKNEATTIASRTETNSRNSSKVQRPRQKNKLDRPKFSVKDYRNRLNSTTSTTEKNENTPRIRFPPRKNAYTESIFSDIETTTERKKFIPKEPRHKLNRTENNEQEIHSRHRQKQNTEETDTHKISSRVRNGQRRQKPTEETTEHGSTITQKRPQRKRLHDSEIGESVQDVSVTDTTGNSDHKNDITSERSRSESAIMKIADKKHQDQNERLFEHSKRVSDLTLAASKDYNTPGMFKTVSSNSRRIPSYFTIATDDPILPIEAFFPQLNQKKES